MTSAPFQNEPFLDFTQPAHIAGMEAALAQIRAEAAHTYPLIIGGEQIMTEATIASLNPARPSEVVGRVASASVAQAGQALEAATAAFAGWRAVPMADRVALVRRAADAIRQRRYAFTALLVLEVSKSWAEADADVAEAIDFAEYYAREALRLDAPAELVQMPGEHSVLRYVPLGAGVAIPPWNFPLAIMVGLTLAPVVVGNTIVLKPASTSPVVAAKFAQLLVEIGLPAGVVNFLPGPGGAIGDALVDSPLTRFIAFTGSKEVGLRIFERAAKHQPGQKWLKRTVLEMGGKDTIIVDETADLDAAAAGIVASAFGFQGQKCSACSRVVAVDAIYDTLLQKVVDRARTIVPGDPADGKTAMGAVIDAKAHDKITEYIALGAQEGRVVLGGAPVAGEGYFIAPTIIADIAPDARLSQEEVFGPVLAFVRAADFDAALDVANNTEYGLTGGLFSADAARLARTREEFHVGNLYLNRKITGAMVGAHPFGGFNMSGTDSKAGGADYLLLFTQAKTIAEKL